MWTAWADTLQDRNQTFPSLTWACWRLPCASSQVSSLPPFPQHHRFIVSVLKPIPRENHRVFIFHQSVGRAPWIPNPACIHEQRHRWHFTIVKGREMRSSEFPFCVLTHRRERPGTWSREEIRTLDDGWYSGQSQRKGGSVS